MNHTDHYTDSEPVSLCLFYYCQETNGEAQTSHSNVFGVTVDRVIEPPPPTPMVDTLNHSATGAVKLRVEMPIIAKLVSELKFFFSQKLTPRPVRTYNIISFSILQVVLFNFFSCIN